MGLVRSIMYTIQALTHRGPLLARAIVVVCAALALLLSACVPGVFASSRLPDSVATAVEAWVCGEEPLSPAYQPTLFVATNGSDASDGRSVEAPFKTLQRAVDEAGPGDVVWVRGGVYGSDVEFRRSGLPGRPIVVESYPGECAVFDGAGLERVQRIRLTGVRHVVLRNFVVRNSPSEGVFLMDSHDVTVSHVRSHHNHMSGFLTMGGDRNLFSHVIAHDNVDRPHGGDADGIGISTGDGNRIHYCVTFANSDDGVDTWLSTNTLVERCVSFDNGRLEGDGNGFKLGGGNEQVGTVVRRSIAFGNKVDGFDYNSGRGLLLEHNTAFANGRYGFVTRDAQLHNNLSVGNGAGDQASSERGNVLRGNSWTLGLGEEALLSTDPDHPRFLGLAELGGAVGSGVPLGAGDSAGGVDVGALTLGERIASAWRLGAAASDAGGPRPSR